MPKNRTNAEWLMDLRAEGLRQAEALEALRQVMLRAARHTFDHYLGDEQSLPADKIAGLAEDCAQDAVMAVLTRLHEFRGDSRFTTWAYKFGVNIALKTARREIWKSVSLDGLADDSNLPAAPSQPGGSSSQNPELPSLKGEVWSVIADVIQRELTPRQREVLILMVFQEIPMDVVVERLGTNRNAVYKLLHDARVKVKTQLVKRGIGIEDALRIFSTEK